MGLNTINHNALSLLLDEMDNLQAMQINMNRKIDMIEKLIQEVEKVVDYQDREISDLQRENYQLNRAG